MSEQFLLLADTQIVVWYLLDPGRLTEAARDAVAHSVDSGVPVAISAYSVLELVYAAEKQSNPFIATAEVLSIPIVSADRKFPSMTQQNVVW